MSEQSTIETDRATVTWDNLDGLVREHVQRFIQSLLEEELTAFLGRAKSQRRSTVDDAAGYRNGHGKPRKVTLPCGTIEVERPRARDLEARFESKVLPLFVRRTKLVDGILPELYLHGLALGDFELAMKSVLGDDAPVSDSVISKLKEKWQLEYSAWKARDLSQLEPVYLWIDGVYVKAGLEKDKAALLVVLAALSDGTKTFLAIEPGHRESTESWSSVLRSLRERGLKCPALFIGDGNLGAWAAIRSVYPDAKEQRCWNHRVVNLLDRIKRRHQPEAKALLTKIAYAESRDAAEVAKQAFKSWCNESHYHGASEAIEDDWERMVSFFEFPKQHWLHLRTTNAIESPFASLRLRTNASKRFKKVENASAMVWKLLMLAERGFHALQAPELLEEVYRNRNDRNKVNASPALEDRPAA